MFAIGSPHGLELTLTEGPISALRPRSRGQLPIIQTSAPVSTGSRGGGLFDDEAGLVTIETVFRLASARKDGRRDEVVKRHPAVRDSPYAIHPRYSKGKRPQHFIGKFNLNINPSPFPFVQDG